MEPDLRDEIMDNILNQFKGWDGSIESGVSIIEYNELFLDRLKGIISKLGGYVEDKEYIEKILLISKEQEKLIKALRYKQKDLLDRIGQLNKKEKVINNYISVDRQPIFVDKAL